MAKQEVKKEVEARQDLVEVVKNATQAHGSSQFLRVNIPYSLNIDELVRLQEAYKDQGYEVFSNQESVVLLKQ